MGKLILARHHESEWNKLGIWTGTRDTHLTNFGFAKSEDMGLLVKDIYIDQAFASMQVRSIETLSCMLDVCKRYKVPTEHAAELNERDYGDYTGKNKWDMRKLLGGEFKKLRRGWDYPIPNGESLKMVYDRTVPYFLNKILPLLRDGKNILVVAHGNSLRSLIKYIENISDESIAEVEFDWGTVVIYELDNEGHMVKKEVREANKTAASLKSTRTQIVATLGPASQSREVLIRMLKHNMNVARLNFAWSDKENKAPHIKLLKDLAVELDMRIPIIADLPGPRIQLKRGHTYDKSKLGFSENDATLTRFGVEHGVDYFALSFVRSKQEIQACRDLIKKLSGTQKIIAKIECLDAVHKIDEIIAEADGIMVARGDLGNEVRLEQIPFIQDMIIKKCKHAGKPVIIATQMLLSMTASPTPTRAEVTDVANAILEGSDAVMLSEETTVGKYPVETVEMMEKIIIEADKHMGEAAKINLL